MGQRQCQQISRNAGLEGKRSSLRRAGRTLRAVGRECVPKDPSPEPLQTTAGPQWLQVAKHHHFTLPKQSDLSHTTCSSLSLPSKNDSFPSEFFGLTPKGTARFPCFQRFPHHQLAKEGTIKKDPKILPISLSRKEPQRGIPKFCP